MTRLLVVEDNDVDFLAIRRAIERAGGEVEIKRTTTGRDTLLTLQEAADTHTLPDVVLLDLNLDLDDSNGRAVLWSLKADERLADVPVVILSGIDSAEVVAECYRNGASGYCVKPSEPSEFEAAVRRIHDYWLRSVALPSRVYLT